MKKIFYLIAVPLLLVSGSCKKFLDQQPISSLSEAKFWRTATDAPLGMAGIYDGFQVVSRNFIEWGDARSDNMIAGGSGTDQFNVGINALTPSLGLTNWSSIYTVISRCNTALKFLPGISGLTDREKNNYLGQCYAMRSLMYFHLVRLWGDVPVWTEPFDYDVPSDLPRTAVSEIMAKIIVPDMVLAESLMDPARTLVYELNIGSVYALQTDVYMWNKDFAKAIAASDKLIASNRYSLAPKASWKQIFTAPTVTRENIFNIAYDYLKDGVERNTTLIGVTGSDAMYQIDNTTSQESAIHLRFQAQKALGDIRADLTYDTRLTGNSARKIGKYFELTSPTPPFPTNQFVYALNSNANTSWPVYRYADHILLRAEALNQVGGASNRAAALAIVNQVRARAGLATPLVLSDYPTTKALETVILDERQTELFAEGKRWFDLMRTGRVLEVMDPEIRKREVRAALAPQGFTDARKILLPISRSALIANRSLKQNAPWSE